MTWNHICARINGHIDKFDIIVAAVAAPRFRIVNGERHVTAPGDIDPIPDLFVAVVGCALATFRLEITDVIAETNADRKTKTARDRGL